MRPTHEEAGRQARQDQASIKEEFDRIKAQKDEITRKQYDSVERELQRQKDERLVAESELTTLRAQLAEAQAERNILLAGKFECGREQIEGRVSLVMQTLNLDRENAIAFMVSTFDTKRDKLKQQLAAMEKERAEDIKDLDISHKINRDWELRAQAARKLIEQGQQQLADANDLRDQWERAAFEQQALVKPLVEALEKCHPAKIWDKARMFYTSGDRDIILHDWHFQRCRQVDAILAQHKKEAV